MCETSRRPPPPVSLGKRLVKSPKLYFADTGVLRAMPEQARAAAAAVSVEAQRRTAL